jgi:hypothetical protein
VGSSSSPGHMHPLQACAQTAVEKSAGTSAEGWTRASRTSIGTNADRERTAPDDTDRRDGARHGRLTWSILSSSDGLHPNTEQYQRSTSIELSDASRRYRWQHHHQSEDQLGPCGRSVRLTDPTVHVDGVCPSGQPCHGSVPRWVLRCQFSPVTGPLRHGCPSGAHLPWGCDLSRAPFCATALS